MKESNKRLKTKRTIENAMVQLLTEQPFDQISTVKLAEKAGMREIPIITIMNVGFLKIAFHSLNIFPPFLNILSKFLI